MVDIVIPSSRDEWLSLRQPTVGASETPAVLGVHPKVTPFEVWAKKSGLVQTTDNKHMRRGNRLQPVVVDMIREERPTWIVKANMIPGGRFYQDLEVGISCTPDTEIKDPDRDGLGTCEIKTLDCHVFKSDWTIDGDIQVPPYVALQVIQTAYLMGASWCCVAALVGFDLDLHILDVDIHQGIIARIKRTVPDFLRRVRENDPPGPDYARDGDVLKSVYAGDDGGTTDFASLESGPYNRLLKLVARREAMKEIEGAAAEAVKERKTIDAELIHFLGNATRGVLVDGRVIEAKTIRKKGFTVEPSVFRSVKIKRGEHYADH